MTGSPQRAITLPCPSLLWALVALLFSTLSPAQQAAPVHGTVLTASGQPVAAATVELLQGGSQVVAQTTTNAAGEFFFAAMPPGSYSLTAEKEARRSPAMPISSSLTQSSMTLVLSSPANTRPMEFADQPNFTVAGVTDWTAVGGHGSDSTLRTSEDLARESAALQPQASHNNSTSPATQLPTAVAAAEQHRRAGQLDEKNGDPLAAVHELQQAVHLDPSEENYFAWGSELLLHRAVWQAAEVFRNGSKAYPNSARMLTALGTALFAGALYDDAAASLCAAADLDPSNAEAYTFMGRVRMETANPLPCVEPRLARFAQQQPANPVALYLYAMAICKRQPTDPQVPILLKKTIALDPGYAEAYLQLGILAAGQHQTEQAIAWYTQALQANPQLGEAHYRLGVAYDRSGAPEKAHEQFQLHDQIEHTQAAAIEQQRREVKQFLVVLDAQPHDPSLPVR